MKKVVLVDQGKTGLFPEHYATFLLERLVAATVKVMELLMDHGAKVSVVSVQDDNSAIAVVTLGNTMPERIVAVIVNVSVRLRLEDEPPYPGEYQDFWNQVEWTPCPLCGAPVIWYEAGYVPGYRVCTRPPHHHLLAKHAEE